MPITYIKGDATCPQVSGAKIICNIVNDLGKWGKGFVLAISKRWKEPEARYRSWHAQGEKGHFILGAVQFVQAEKYIWIANMVAQHGIGTGSSGPPIRYDSLAQCLRITADQAQELSASIHMPRIGCGLAGGDWKKVEPLIEEHLCGQGIAVTVYDFK
jgi:O-acetyl-ADP-ribose deacetylase (regulator of RNase III)